MRVLTNCKGCDAVIFWAANNNTGRMSPIDAVPNDEGNCYVDESENTFKVVGVVERNLIKGTHKLYTNHFMTCPKRERFKKK